MTEFDRDAVRKAVFSYLQDEIGERGLMDLLRRMFGSEEPEPVEPAPTPEPMAYESCSLHIAVSYTDAKVWGSANKLSGPRRDNDVLAFIARQAGYGWGKQVADTSATISGVLDEIRRIAAYEPKRFLLTYSGHGMQIPDRDGDEDDGMDEAWCLYDGPLLDDRLRVALASFSCPVVVLSDSCHSGTVTRAVGLSSATQDRRHQVEWVAEVTGGDITVKSIPCSDEVLSHIEPIAKEQRASAFRPGGSDVVLLSGCQDNQLSYDTPSGGMFTKAVAKVWDEGRFVGDWNYFAKRVRAMLPDRQSPNLLGPDASLARRAFA